jgi:glycine/D-amino acid oxidase-like deaminating enzyme/nitrite reductase/ring-hydroxylating ferredoxin subunit
MNVGDERSASLWSSVEVAPDVGALKNDIESDVVVVGSGIAGLSTAYELAELGRKVVVIDRGRIATGMTARTTAHLTSISDDGFDTVISVRGEEAARLFHESHAAAITRIEGLQERLGISCNFRRLEGCLFPALDGKPSDLDPQIKAAKKLRLQVEDKRGLPLKGLEQVRYLSYADQATFHPLKYLNGITAALQAKGAILYSNTPALRIEENDQGVRVALEGGHEIRAKIAVVATNSPINNIGIHTKEAPYRTYAMTFTVPRGMIPDRLYWDTADPYHYVRLNPGPGTTDYLIVGGADHKTGEADDAGVRFERIEAWMRSLVPELGPEKHRWSGQILDPIDYSAFIGRNPGEENVFVVTGDSGQGITHGVVASLLIRDLITEGSSPWTELYDPGRVIVKAAKNFIKENITALTSFAEYVAPGELNSVDELKKGQGAIVREGLKKVAAYRDDNGTLIKRSAACTHVGCHLHWNSLERCWDCPCHGSHFSPLGDVLNAPAISPLSKIE